MLRYSEGSAKASLSNRDKDLEDVMGEVTVLALIILDSCRRSSIYCFCDKKSPSTSYKTSMPRK